MNFALSFVVLALAVLATGEKLRYDGYKVHRLTPHTEGHLHMIRELEKLGASYWSEPTTLGKSSDVMFPPHLQGELFSSVKTSGMKVESFIDDVQKLIDANDNKTPKGSRLALDKFATLDQIDEFLDELAAKHSSIASIISIGNSTEGRPLRVLKISRSGETRPAIWIDANIHAREWITSAVSLYITNEILNGNGSLATWSEDFDLYILNVLNPDGFVHSHNTERLWRKTRSVSNSALGCKGADANRNFGFHWLDGGSSTNPCSDTYAGAKAFSEPETQAVADFIETISDRLVFYLSLHSYSQYILLPYGHDNEKIPQYYQYLNLSNAAAAAHAKRYGTRFIAGNIVDLLYVASGGSMDYVKGTFNTNLTLTYELRDTGRYGFILPADQIVPSALELIDGLELFIEALRNGIDTPQASTVRDMSKRIVQSPRKIAKPAIVPARRPHHQPNRAHLKREMNTETFGNVPQARRGLSPLSSFRH